MHAAPPDPLTERLAELIEEARARTRTTRRPVLVSAAQPVSAADPLDVLEALARAAELDAVPAARAAGGHMYWTRPADRFALAGIGAVVTLGASGAGRFEAVDREWVALRDGAVVHDPSGGAPGVGSVLMGGFSFDPGGPRTSLWSGFPAALLTLPRLQLAETGGECWVTVNLRVGVDGEPDADPAALVRLVSLALAEPPREVSAAVRDPDGSLTSTDVLSADAWRALVAAAVDAIHAGELAKVVLARAVRASAARNLDTAAAIRHLRAMFPSCYTFAFWRGDSAFVGASPERLARLDGRDVRSGSLAGSIRRGTTRGEDVALAADLMASAKDRAEHVLVRSALCDGLAEVCDSVTAPGEPAVLTLPHVHHLHTPVRARLRAGGSLLDVVGRLHPTPAVGGVPREEALRFIRAHERLDRGWYAAPLGWLGTDRGEFAVALRSALVTGHEAWLFAGCGIVAESSPEGEYDESLLKLRPMQLALGAALAAGDDAAPGEPMRATTVGGGAL